MATFALIAVVLTALTTPALANDWDFTWRSTGRIPSIPTSGFDVMDRTTASVTALPTGTPADPTPQLSIQWSSPAGVATLTIRQVSGAAVAFGDIPEFLPWPDTSAPPQWRLGTSSFAGTYTWTGPFERPLSFDLTLREAHAAGAPSAQFFAGGALRMSKTSEPGLLPIAGVNQFTFAAGQTLSTTVGLINPGMPATADVYVGLLCPDGTIVFFDQRGGTALVRVVDDAAFSPITAGVSLASPFSVQVPNFFVYTWNGNEHPGTYLFFLLAVRRGAVPDGAVSDDDVLALATADFVAFP